MERDNILVIVLPQQARARTQTFIFAAGICSKPGIFLQAWFLTTNILVVTFYSDHLKHLNVT